MGAFFFVQKNKHGSCSAMNGCEIKIKREIKNIQQRPELKNGVIKLQFNGKIATTLFWLLASSTGEI